MERVEFTNRTNENIGRTYNEEYVRENIRESSDLRLGDGYPRGYHNSIIAMEECGELIQAISKMMRYGNNENTKRSLLEEMADVQIIIYYLQDIYNLPTELLHAAILTKIDRLERRISSYKENKEAE